MARKQKLTKELIKKAEIYLKAGNYDKTVCEFLQIHPSSWYRWLQEGEQATRGLKKEFYDTVKKSRASAEISAVTGILNAGKENWTALAWFLERRFKDNWRKDEKITVDGNMKNHNIDLSAYSLQELEEIAGTKVDDPDEEE